ncbi:hypothetical protein SB773_30925, partial [Bacillus sp. SIMBA_074]
AVPGPRRLQWPLCLAKSECCGTILPSFLMIAAMRFLLAAVLIGAGIAQRTFVGPDSQQTQVKIDEPAPFVLLDGDVLRTNPGVQTLIVRGQGDIFGSY